MAKVSEKGLIARKVGMARMTDASGAMIPVTLLKVEDQQITKILTPERDGYHGFQIGFYVKAEKNLTKADITRLRKANIEKNYSRFTEFRTSQKLDSYEPGTLLSAELFKEIASVDITGISKGRGFQGSVKRWNSAVGRMTHGSRFHRRPGSLGSNTTPGRVFKNKHQPGQLGVETVTLKNLKVMEVDVEENVIVIKGSIPGHREGFVELRPTNSK
jgi:large subunit ribosomal protein L3